MTFVYFDEQFELFDDPYNTTILNERAVEIPIARAFLATSAGDGLEVGNVLGHYGHHGHRVIDRYEDGPDVENLDVFALDGHHDWIVSISTLEHVRRDEPTKNPHGAAAALVYLAGLGDRMLVTVPLGHNAALDELLMRDELDTTRRSTLVRDGESWIQTPELEYRPYGLTTKWAESVWIGEWGTP